MAKQWSTLAEGFPPTLNKDTPATGLKPMETPDGYGFNLNVPGRLASGSIPTGTAATLAYGTGSYTAYRLIYNRLWTTATNVLSYGAPEYTASFFEQGLGSITFPEASAILAYMPFGSGDIGVLTAVGAYVVNGAQGRGGGFTRGHLIQELAIAAATYAVELGGIIYVSNAGGLFAWSGEQYVELTAPVRNNLTGFASKAILADYVKRRIIGTSAFVYDVPSKRLFDFNTAGFLYTSPTLVSDGYRPFVVEKVAFVVEYADANPGTITVQTKLEEDAWSLPDDVQANYQEERFTRIEYCLPTPQSAKRFTLKLTSLSSNIYIREIQVFAEGFTQGAYAK
jgi:hypothetical protein